MKVIGLVFLTALALTGCDAAVDAQGNSDSLQVKTEKQAAKENTETKDKAKTLNNDKMSDTALYIKCQLKIQNGLNNPRSFDPEIRSLKYIIQDNGDPLIGFKFYAENSFGGEGIHQAVCGFDKDGEIVTAGYK